jgi:hypothetical protein
MKPVLHTSYPDSADRHASLATGTSRQSPVTRFSDTVDVRNRGALRINRFSDGQMRSAQDAPAVVRLWLAQQCHELSAHAARALAEQLLAAAAYADRQNSA